MSVEERTVLVEEGSAWAGDVAIAYTAVGEGKPIVAVHGGPGLGHAYLRGLDVLADEYRVVFYDQRGAGRTKVGDPGKVTFAGAVADLEALRQELEIERLNLIGHSFGGLIALLYAEQHPDRVGSLVSYASGPPLVPELAERLWATMAERRTPADDEELARLQASKGFAERDPKTLERVFLNRYVAFFDDRANRDGIDMGFTEITAANVLESSDRMRRDLESHRPLARLDDVTCPTLVVSCENDAIPEEFSRLLADRIPGAQYAYLADTNHFAHVENPALLEATLKGFLRRHAV